MPARSSWIVPSSIAAVAQPERTSPTCWTLQRDAPTPGPTCTDHFHPGSYVARPMVMPPMRTDRKSTRLNSSHLVISYAVFCLKKNTEWPDPQADEGRHECNQPLDPHGGGCKEAMTVLRGYELTYKLVFFFLKKPPTTDISPLSLHRALPI